MYWTLSAATTVVDARSTATHEVVTVCEPLAWVVL